MFDKYWESLLTYAKTFIQGWKSFYLPAEPLFFVQNFTIPAVIGSTLNNQAIDLRLGYDYYVYGVGLRSSAGVFSWLLRASGGGIFFANAPVFSDAFWSAQNPTLWLRRPFKIQTGASLVADFTNQVAGANTVQIGFLGWKQATQYQTGL